mgnify:CR=1 FL=1|tara:strand:+ start:534 stop:1400 length:867 start_codon:yes stop_codon:yes gene_type:complete
MKTEDFKVELDGEEKTFTARSPSLADQREAQKVYNTAFTDAIKSNSVVRAKMDDVLEDQGLWNKEKQAKYETLQEELNDGEKRLAKGGFSLVDAKKLALKMRNIRLEIRDLISVRTSLDNHSAEGQADNARFNYLVSACVVYKDNDKPYFKDLADYMDRMDDPVALEGASKLATMIYGLDNNFEKNLPENKFLKKYKFVNDELRFINKEGHTVDSDGRLVDENGRYIDKEGKFVDKDGNRVDEDGDYVVDSQPFLDDDGNPVVLEEEEKKKEDEAPKTNDKDAKAESD